MRVSLTGKRAALVSLFPLLAAGLQGCATLESGTNERGAFSQDGSSAPTIEVADRAVLDRQADGVGIVLTDSAVQKNVVLDAGVPVSDYTLTTLDAPSRVVIDLPRVQVGSSREVKTPELDTVKGIRLGKHADKSRVVLDIAEGRAVTPQANLVDGRIVVTLATTGTEPLPVSPETFDEQPGTQTGATAEEMVTQAPSIDVATAEQVQLPADEQVALAPTTEVAAEQVAMLAEPTVSEVTTPEPIAVAAEAAATEVDVARNEPTAVVSEGEVDASARAIPAVTVTDDAPSAEEFPAVLPPTQDVTPEVADLPVINAAPAKVELPPEKTVKATEITEPVKKVQPVSETTTSLPTGASASVEVANVEINEPASDQPSLTVSLSRPTDFFITRTAPSEYVLTIKNSKVSVLQEEAPVFAAANSKGIRSARTTTSGRDTLVRIFAQPETYLTARASGTSLIIEETRNVAQISNDLRAQPKAEEKAPKVEPKVDEAPKAVKKPAIPAVPEKEVEPVKAPAAENDLAALLDEGAKYTGRLITLDLQDTDIDNALRIIAEVSNLNIVASDEVSGKITLRLVDVPWDQALDVILKSNGLDKVLEGNVMRIAPIDKLRQERESLRDARAAEDDLEPLTVRYLRVSYARASEIQPLVETVLSDRGSVAYDERSNQLIVKDIRRGVKNVLELIKKIDLRTPQVLLETQIIEASRNLTRELGSQLGFQYIQSPATGNGTGLNFPSAVAIGGSATPALGNLTGSNFPAAISSSAGSAVTMLFDSADGTKSLSLRLSQLEQEGRIKIISRPAVATTNNKPAEIKSVEKVRIRMPNGGFSVATGAGASAQGTGGAAAQTIEAGIILKVTPQASPDYYVLLDIRAKSSTFSSKTTDGIPNEIERAASSTVLVSSGQTFALGGIYKITDQDTLTGVPFLMDIPFLGTFFRNSKVENSDEELLFFITPRVVEGSFDDASMKAVS